MGQNNSEAQSHTLTAFLPDLSSPVDHEDVFPVLRANIDKNGGIQLHAFVLLISSLKHLL